MHVWSCMHVCLLIQGNKQCNEMCVCHAWCSCVPCMMHTQHACTNHVPTNVCLDAGACMKPPNNQTTNQQRLVAVASLSLVKHVLLNSDSVILLLVNGTPSLGIEEFMLAPSVSQLHVLALSAWHHQFLATSKLSTIMSHVNVGWFLAGQCRLAKNRCSLTKWYPPVIRWLIRFNKPINYVVISTITGTYPAMNSPKLTQSTIVLSWHYSDCSYNYSWQLSLVP